MKVLIVGAGPTGLTAGIELCRFGLVPTIVDKRESASTHSRAVGITPRSLDLLKPSGVSAKLIAEGVALNGLRVYHGTSLSLELPLHSKRMAYPCVLAMPQDRTEAIMSGALGRAWRGCCVRKGIPVLQRAGRQNRRHVLRWLKQDVRYGDRRRRNPKCRAHRGGDRLSGLRSGAGLVDRRC